FQLVRDGVQRRPCAGDGHTGLEPRHHAYRLGFITLERIPGQLRRNAGIDGQRYPEIGVVDHRGGALKIARRASDDLARVPVNVEKLAADGPVGSEAVAPETVAHD